MIVNGLFYIVGFIVGSLAKVLPKIQVWPDVFLEGVEYFGNSLMRLNFLLPVYEFSILLEFAFNTFLLLGTAKGLLMIINFFRGSGKIEV